MAIYPNKTLDYRTFIDWTPGLSGSGWSSVTVRGVVVFTYGVPYDPGDHGIQIEFETTDTPSLETSITISTPWGTYTDTVSGAIPQDLWVYFDNAHLYVGEDCDEWRFTADKIGFYTVEDRTTALLEFTSIDSGLQTGFNRRDCVSQWTADVSAALPTPGNPVPGCTALSVNASSGFDDCFNEQSAVGAGVWARKSIEFEPLAVPDANEDESCESCESAISGIVINEDNSFDVTGTFDASLTHEEVSVPCPCPVPIGEDPVSEPYVTRRSTWQFTDKGANLYPAPTDFKIPSLEREAYALKYCCEGAEPTPGYAPSDILTGITRAQYSLSSLNSQGVKWCPYDYVQNCESTGTPHGPCAGPDECCYYYAETAGAWLDPGCPEPSANWISSDVSTSKLHIVAIGQEGDVRLILQDHELLEVFGTDHSIGADWGSVCFDKTTNPLSIWLFTEISGEIFAQKSTDCGQTLSSATKIGDGMKPDACISLSGIQFVYWFDGTDIKGRRFDRAGTALEAAFTVVSGADEDGLACTIATIAGGISRVVLRYFVGGSLTTKTSVDGINFS